MAKVSYYGVRVGRQPGVYTSWDACSEQVKGFPDAKFQKFKTEAEAQAFAFPEAEKVSVPLQAQTPVKESVQETAQKETPVKKASKSFYAVREGRHPGVYTTWAECQEQIQGYSGAKYKKFSSEDVANLFVAGYDIQEVPLNKQKAPSKTVSVPDGPYAFVDGSFNAETGVYGYGGFVCVDGRRYPVQGHGNDADMASMRNVAGEISGSMAAVRKAEELGLRELTILYDYKGIEEWAKGSWKTNRAGTREYRDFMNAENRLTQVAFQKVAAHTGIEGNEMADVMAKNAVGISLTKSQQELLNKALSSGKRDGIPGFDTEDLQSQQDAEFDMFT